MLLLVLTELESRLIYKVSHSISNIYWSNPTKENGAWVYIGNGDELKTAFVFKCISEHFADNILYVSCTRSKSLQTSKDNIEAAIKDILGNHDFTIWDTQFKKVIEFNKNGVMRLGEVKS